MVLLKFASGFLPNLFQNVLHLMDDLAPVQGFARLVFRVGLEKPRISSDIRISSW
ncbi:MAG TPA: hypothetical protein VKS78_19720 [Roseiarcus sp.]|nr:hypothetical protein [Roseiarcus sp.]